MPGASTPWAWVIDLVAAGAWLGTGLLLAFVIARLVRPDSNLLLIWANAYTFWIYLPAYGIALFAGAFQRWYLLGAAGIVAAFHLAWVLPDYRPAEDIPAEAREAPMVRLMTTNVYFGNADYSGIAEEILEEDPDILFLQEYGPKLEAELRESGVEDAYQHKKIAYENEFFGLATYSRLPLVDVEVFEAGGRPVIAVTVEVDGNPVRLYNVHPTSPGIGQALAHDWNNGWQTIVEEAEDEELPLVIAGDFNMNQHHRWYNELKDNGMDNCHEERGRGNATTWPQQRKLRPIRIDHVFHSDALVCMSVEEGRGDGSDHRPVIAELAILGE